MRTQADDQSEIKQGSLELIRVKILLHGPEDAPNSIRLELSSEADLFFHYTHFIEDTSFREVQDAQKLMVEFPDYPTVLVRMLNSCIKEPHIHLAILTIFDDGTDARLDFIQNMEYKFVELMYCLCSKSPEEVVQHHITYRYNLMKQKLSIMQSRLQEVNNLVKIKNPSLLLQLQKHTLHGTPTSMQLTNSMMHSNNGKKY